MKMLSSGIGAVAGPMLAEWAARKESRAKIISAEADKEVVLILAEAHSKAQKILLGNNLAEHGEITLSDSNFITERIQYQEQKRTANIKSVVSKAAHMLEDKEVPDTEPDHDWTARFFSEVQDVSSEDIQILWAKILAGEVQKPKSTSIRTLGILREMDTDTANLFGKFCSMCMFLEFNQEELFDGRIPSLGKSAGDNSLLPFGLGFGSLNQLQEYGLIIPDYNAWREYSRSMPFRFQKKWWLLPINSDNPVQEFKINGPSLSISGLELSRIVECEPMPEYAKKLQEFFKTKNLEMTHA